MAVFQVGAPQGMIKDVNPTALPNEFFHIQKTLDLKIMQLKKY